MAEPITTGAILLSIGCGIAGNATQAFGISGYRKLADILRRGTLPQNHNILRATHSAHVSAMRVMHSASCELASSEEEKQATKTFGRLVKDPAFAKFRLDGEHFPLDEANSAIDRMFSGGLGSSAGNAPAEIHAAYNRVIVEDLRVWGVDLPPLFETLFVKGVGDHQPWHLTFRTCFADIITDDRKALDIFTLERLTELRGMGVQLIETLDDLQAKLEAGFHAAKRRDAEMLVLLRQIADERKKEDTQASFELLRAIADGYSEQHGATDIEQLRDYLASKIDQWKDYQKQIEEMRSEGNLDTALLADAKIATDAGDFKKADQLLAEAENALDAKLEVLQISKASRRALRGNNARLAGEFQDALSHYDEAAGLAPDGSEIQRRYRISAALTAHERGASFGGKNATTDAVDRWRKIAADIDQQDDGVDWIWVQGSLGNALLQLGLQIGRIEYFREAVATHESALKLCVEKGLDDQTAVISCDLGHALWSLALRENSDALYVRAVDAFEEVLTNLSAETNPDLWTNAQYGKAAALEGLGNLRWRPEEFEEAIEALQACIDVASDKELQRKWADAQQSLGICYKNFGCLRSRKEDFETAIGAYREALTVRTREKYPMSWAGLQDDLGNAYAQLGEHSKEQEDFQKAVACHEASLEIRQRDRIPFRWALTKENLGTTLMKQARIFSRCSAAKRAVEELELAVAELNAQDMEWNRNKAQSNLRNAKTLVARLCKAE